MPEASEDQASRVPVFRARRLCKTYVMGEVQVHALRDVDLDIHQGEFVVLGGYIGLTAASLGLNPFLCIPVAAAAMLEPAKRVKNLHTVFARAGTVKLPVDYTLDMFHSGRAFGSIEAIPPDAAEWDIAGLRGAKRQLISGAGAGRAAPF